MKKFILRIMLLTVITSIGALPIYSASEIFSYTSVNNESEIISDEVISNNKLESNQESKVTSNEVEKSNDITTSESVESEEESIGDSKDLLSESDSRRASLDYGDAPGYVQSQIAIDQWSDSSSSPAFFLGFDRASFDISNYREELSGLGDDLTVSSTPYPSSYYDPYSTDDETGFVYKTQDTDGKINFSKSQPIKLTVPYENTRSYPGNILLWIDFDGDKIYEADEGVMKPIRPGQTIGSYNPPDGDKYYNSYGVYNYFRNSEELEITPPSGTVDDTYMRVVLTNDTSVGLDDGNMQTYPGVGEIEEYPVHFYNTSTTCSVAKTLNDPKMSYTNVEESEQKVTYRGIQNPTDGTTFDLEITIEDPGSGNNTRLDATRDYPLENYGSRNEGVLVTPQIINNNYSGSARVTIRTYYANSNTPYPIPLQFTINDMDGDSGSYEYIENISDMVSYKMESDSNIIISSDMTRATYSGENISTNGIDGYFKEDFNAVSAQKFSYTTSSSYVHTLDIGRSSKHIFGQFPMQISFPSDLPSDCQTGDTVIDKTIMNESIDDDGVLQEGETVTYQVKVKNNTNFTAENIHIRDSLLENLPQGITQVGSVSISPTIATSGSLTNGTFYITSLAAGQEATLTYKISYSGGLSEGKVISNIVTDDGSNPMTGSCSVTTGYQDNQDCEQLTISGEGDQDEFVNIDKKIISQTIANDDNFSTNELVTYQIAVKNTSMSTVAQNIRVRDSLLIDLPSGVSLVGRVNVSPSNIAYSGSLQADNFIIDSLAPQSEVKITYTLTYTGGLNDGYRLTNVATDNGDDPSTISSCVPSNGYEINVDCEEISIHNVDSAVVDKTVTDKGNEIAEPGEYLYYTITETSTYDSIQLVDTFDENIDPSTIEITSVTENGVPLNVSNYSYDIVDNKLTIDIPASTVTPGLTYQIKYQAKILGSPVNNTNSSIDNTVVDMIPDSKPSDTASIPALLTSKDSITKTVTDGNENGYAQAGEKLIYSIEYKSSIDRQYIQIVDELIDVNLNHVASNIRIYENDQPLDSGRYTFLDNDTIIITEIKADTDYTIIFDTYVNEELDTSRLVITNTVNEVVSETSNQASIPIDFTPILESATITKSVSESDDIETNNGNDIADPGEYLHYEVTYSSNISKQLLLIDSSDINVEQSSLTNVELRIDGNLVNSSNYHVDANDHTNILVFSEIDYPRNSLLTLSYDLKILDDPLDDERTVISNTIIDIDSEVSATAEIDFNSTKPSNGPEVLNKTVIGSTSVNPGDTVRYRLTIAPLKNEATQIEIIDKLDNDYLTFISVDNVYINGSSITGYTDNSDSYVDVVVDHNFEIGDTLEVDFSAKLSSETPLNITVQNKAVAKVDGVETNTPVATIGSGDTNVATETNIYTKKTIISESGGGITDQLEPNENITYEILVQNVTADPTTVLVEDDFVSQQLDKVYRWNDDDLVEVISEEDGVILDTTISELQSGLTLNLEGYETQYVRYRLSGKAILEEMDINPADGDPDIEALNVAQVTPLGLDSLYPGVEIGLPHMNGELSIAKSVTTYGGDHVIQSVSNEYMQYTITVINRGVNPAENVFIKDDFYAQHFESISDLDKYMDQELILLPESGGTFVTPNPTIADLVSTDGVEVRIPAGDCISFTFRLEPKAFDPGNVDVDGDGLNDTEIINTASFYDHTTGASDSASSGVYFESAGFEEIEYLYIDENEFGQLIEGFDMMNKIKFVASDDIDQFSGYITYDNRYLNDIRSDSFEFYVDGVLISTPVSIEYIEQGNTTTAYFTIKYPIATGETVEVINYQPPKNALYETTSLHYSINDMKLTSEMKNSDIYYSAFALN